MVCVYICRRDIQDNPDGHNPTEDAIATMELVKLKLSKGACKDNPSKFILYILCISE